MKKKIVSRVLVMLLLFSLLSSFDSAAMTAVNHGTATIGTVHASALCSLL